LNELLNTAQGWITPILLYYVFNSMVQALPDPDQNSSKKYIFFFRFAHLLAANIVMARKNGYKTNGNSNPSGSA
jgi:hypothetical protein